MPATALSFLQPLSHLDAIAKHNVAGRAIGILFGIAIALLAILFAAGIVGVYR